MKDAELQAWWPALGVVVVELRCLERPAVADALIAAVRAGTCSSEVLGGIGGVLRDHHRCRAQLSGAGKDAWDAVLRDVYRAFPGLRLRHWWTRLWVWFRDDRPRPEGR